MSDWQGPSNSKGLTLDSLHCAICRRLEGKGFRAVLLLPSAHSPSVPSTPGPDIHRRRSRGHSPVPCCSHPGNFLHINSESSQCFETYEEEKLDIKSRTEHLGVQLCFSGRTEAPGGRDGDGEKAEKGNGKDRPAHYANLKISGLCGDSERKRKKKKTLTLGESAACRELQNYQQDLTEWGGGGSLLNLTWGLPRSLVSLPSSGGPSVVPF